MKIPFTLILLILVKVNISFGQLTIGEVYHFNVGDIFQYSAQSAYSYYEYQTTVIEKKWSINKDTTFYKWIKITHFEGQYYKDTFSTIVFNHDSVVLDSEIKKHLGTLSDSAKAWVKYLPENEWFNDTSNNTIAFIDTNTSFEIGDCVLKTEGFKMRVGGQIFENPYHELVYAKGLGNCRSTDISGQPNDGTTTALKYYKKGNLSCGSKVLSTNEIKEQKIAIYPNPFSNQIKIKGVDNAEIRIFDCSGKLLIHQTNSNFINTKHLKPGTYISEIKSAQSIIRKIMIKK